MESNKKSSEFLTKLKGFVKRNFMFVVLLVIVAIFAVTVDSFFTVTNLVNIINQNAYVIVAGVGVAMVMLCGGLDLSVGYQMSLNGVVLGVLLTKTNMPVGCVFLVGLLLGALLSFVNGFLYVKLKIFPFIITLATQYMYQGISYMITNSKNLTPLPASFKYIGQKSLAGIPIGIIIMVIIVAIGSFMLNKTYFGRYLYGLGGNPEAIKLAGVNTDLLYCAIYAIAGLFIGLGTIMLGARTGSYASSMGPGTEFTILAGGFLGGIKMGGGGGGMSNIVVGVLIMAVLGNGMQLMHLGTYPQYLIKGIVLVLAIGFDVYQSKRVIKRAKLIPGVEPKE